jgi:hypothetical protein
MPEFPKRAPCPICGAEITSYIENRDKHGPKLHEYENNYGNCVGQSIYCTGCDYEGPFGSTYCEAIEKWDSQAEFLRSHFSVATNLLKAVEFAGFKQKEAA